MRYYRLHLKIDPIKSESSLAKAHAFITFVDPDSAPPKFVNERSEFKDFERHPKLQRSVGRLLSIISLLALRRSYELWSALKILKHRRC